MGKEPKMSNPLISVIVPVYNVEKYIERCIESILGQTFTDFELIIVNDGSTDKSGEICDRYSNNDPRIRIIHKENGGQSEARNQGLDYSIGNYICFVDGDDFIEPNHLSVLFELIKKYDANIAVGGIYNCYENYRVPQCKKSIEFRCDGEEALKKMLEGVEISGSPCCKLIRREFVENRYFIVGKTYEDAFYLPELLLAADNIAVTTEPLYNYWHRTNSTTTVPFDKRSMYVIEAYEYTMNLVLERKLDLTDVALFRVFWSYFVVLDRILLVENYRNIPQYRQIVAFLKKNWLNILKCGYFQKSRRIAAVALKINVKLYCLLSVLKAKRDEINR